MLPTRLQGGDGHVRDQAKLIDILGRAHGPLASHILRAVGDDDRAFLRMQSASAPSIVDHTRPMTSPWARPKAVPRDPASFYRTSTFDKRKP